MILCEKKKKQRDGGLGFKADFELDMINPISTTDTTFIKSTSHTLVQFHKISPQCFLTCQTNSN